MPGRHGYDASPKQPVVSLAAVAVVYRRAKKMDITIICGQARRVRGVTSWPTDILVFCRVVRKKRKKQQSAAQHTARDTAELVWPRERGGIISTACGREKEEKMTRQTMASTAEENTCRRGHTSQPLVDTQINAHRDRNSTAQYSIAQHRAQAGGGVRQEKEGVFSTAQRE